MAYTEDELYNMSDEELEVAMKEEKAELSSPDTEYEEQYAVEESADEEFDQSDEDTEDTSDDGEEELESGLEQSDEDSDHDASEDDDTEDKSEEDATESDEDTPDGETEEDDDAATEGEEEVAEAPQPVQTHKFKANGREYEFTDKEMFEKFPLMFGQAMDYTKKMQAIKPYRKTIDAIESAQLTHDDINLAIDVLKGDKDAIAEVIKRTGVDALDLDTENSNYIAKDYGRDDKALDIKEVVESIQNDKEYSTTHSILASEWDDASWNVIQEDPKKIALLHEDVKSGLYDKLQPIMDKMKLFGGNSKSDLEYYGMAAQEYANGLRQQHQASEAERVRVEQEAAQAAAQEAEARRLAEAERLKAVKAQEQAREATKKASKKRKAAAPTKSVAGNNQGRDYLDDTDEAFEEFYFKTTGERPPKD